MQCKHIKIPVPFPRLFWVMMPRPVRLVVPPETTGQPVNPRVEASVRLWE